MKKLNKAQLETLAKSSPQGIFLLDEQGQAVWVNEALSSLIGCDCNALLGKTLSDAPDHLKPLYTPDTTIHLEATEQSEELWLTCTTQKMSEGGSAHFISDVTELYTLKQENEKLQGEVQDLRVTDPLTGLPNRRALFQSLEPQVSRSRRYNNALSVVVMRLNKLDAFIDQHGEAAYVDLLVALSEMLNDKIRWADIIGRLNETDFLLVLPETIKEDAQKLVNKVRENLSKLHVPGLDDGTFELSAEFGLAQWGKGDDIGLLMQRARETLTPVS